MAGPWEKYQQADEAGPWQKFAEPSTVAERVGTGIMDPVHGGAQLLEQGVRKIAAPVADAITGFNNWLADKTGLVARLPEGGVNEMVKQREQEYQARRAAAGSDGFDWARLAGNVGNPANLAMGGIGAGATLPLRIAAGVGTGAAMGAAAPVTEGDYWAEKGKQVALGGAVGGALPAGAAAAARVVRPNTPANVNALLAEGVQMTPGQILGGAWKSAEEKLTSAPILGAAIRKGRTESIESFNRAVYKRALDPLGPQASAVAEAAPAGREGIQAVGNYLSAAYDDALARSAPSPVTQQFTASLAGLKSLLPKAAQDHFDDVVNATILGKVTPGGTLTPSVAKEAESILGREAATYMGSSVASERATGAALKQVQAELRDLIAQSNPKVAPEIQKINRAWADLVQMENAGAMLGAKEGVFSPAQYLNSVKRGDKSLRDRKFARGEALNQDFAQIADQVLSSRVPDSGTAGRLFLSGAGLGGIFAAPMHTLGAAAGLGAGSLLYTQPGNALATALLTSRPQAANQLAEFVRRSGNYLPPVGVPAIEQR